MPITELDFPILQHFFCVVEGQTGMPPQPLDATPEQIANAQDKQDAVVPKPLPKGVVLGPDGKPCRTCSSAMSWKSMIKQHDTNSRSATVPSTATSLSTAECPPDVEQLGRSSWTLLHSITAQYPEKPSLTQQLETRQFLGLFGKMYPCWVCADDFQAWMKNGNAPRVSNREEFGRWMCEAHNAVNEKLGKPSFDCGKWEERWRTGWKDGRCD
nr:mitochondrial fad-linked sulfhydryl oxidase erv1 [Quercus suber]